MKKTDFLFTIKKEINRLESLITDPINSIDFNNPFKTNKPQTYVWIDEYNKRN